MTTQNFHGLLTLAIPNAHGTISTAGEQLGNIWRELTVSHCGFVSVVLANSLKSMQRLLVPSFVQNNVGDADAGTEHEVVATTGVVLYTAYVVTHVLIFFWL